MQSAECRVAVMISSYSGTKRASKVYSATLRALASIEALKTKRKPRPKGRDFRLFR